MHSQFVKKIALKHTRVKLWNNKNLNMVLQCLHISIKKPSKPENHLPGSIHHLPLSIHH